MYKMYHIEYIIQTYVQSSSQKLPECESGNLTQITVQYDKWFEKSTGVAHKKKKNTDSA